MTLTGDGSYNVLDTADAIEAEVTDTEAGVLDDADRISTYDVLTLTVAELKQLADEDTDLISSLDIVDSAQNIMAEVGSAGLGALGSGTIMSVQTDDGSELTLTVAQMQALSDASVQVLNGLNVSDTATAVLGHADYATASAVHAEAVTVDEAVNLFNGGLMAEISYSMADVSLADLTLEQAQAVSQSTNRSLDDVSVTDTATTINDQGSFLTAQTLRLEKPEGSEVWAGVTVMQGDSGTDLVANGEPVTMRVYAEDAGTLTLKLETSNPGVFVEVPQSVSAGLNELSFDVSTAPDGIVKAVVFPDLGAEGAGQTYYINDISFPGGVFVHFPEGVPTMAAPAASAVTSLTLYGDDANVAVADFNPNWGEGSTLVPAADVEASVGDVLKMSNLSYQGIQLDGSVDTTGLKSLHLDLWSAGEGTVKLFLISPGPSQAAVTLDVQGGMWNSFDIDLNAYNGVDLSNVIQLMFDKGGDGGLTEFYIDNLMFTDNDPSYALPALAPDALPDGPAPDPSYYGPAMEGDAAPLVLYGDTGVNVNVQDFNPNWGEDSQLIQSLELYADSGATALHMSNLSFQGIQISGGDQPALDVSGHNSLHIDMWSATDGHVDLFLVSGDWPNNAETSVKLEVSAGSWNSFNIDLGAYADAVDLTNVTQMKFDKGDSGLSEFYIDNLLFSSAQPDYALPVQGPVVESYLIDVTFITGSDAEAFGGAAIEHTIVVRPELVTAVADSTDLTSLGDLEKFADRIDLDGQDVSLTVEQAGLEVIGGGSFNVVDGADRIADELSADSAGVIDAASNVFTTDGELVLTVAEFKQLMDEDTTLASSYSISDTADNIEAEIAGDGTSVGVLGGAQSVGATDETITTTVAGANALLGATTVLGGYAVDDSHISIQSAFDDGLEES